MEAGKGRGQERGRDRNRESEREGGGGEERTGKAHDAHTETQINRRLDTRHRQTGSQPRANTLVVTKQLMASFVISALSGDIRLICGEFSTISLCMSACEWVG